MWLELQSFIFHVRENLVIKDNTHRKTDDNMHKNIRLLAQTIGIIFL